MESQPGGQGTLPPALSLPMRNPVEVDRWALLHLVLSVGLLPEPGELHQRDDLRRCLAACVDALRERPDAAPVVAA